MADNKLITVESRTVLSRQSTRKDIGSTRVSMSVSEFVQQDGLLDPGETLTVGAGDSIKRFFQLTVEKPLEVQLSTEANPTGLTMIVTEHLFLTSDLALVILHNSNAVGTEPISFRMVYA